MTDTRNRVSCSAATEGCPYPATRAVDRGSGFVPVCDEHWPKCGEHVWSESSQGVVPCGQDAEWITPWTVPPAEPPYCYWCQTHFLEMSHPTGQREQDRRITEAPLRP